MPTATPARQESGEIDLSDYPNVIDMTVFEQILEMDDDPVDREFSKDIVMGFIEQAESTLQKMKASVEEEDLEGLSAFGHFLKGSSATLGLVKMQKSCEKIQNFGKRLDATGEKSEPDSKKSLRDIRTSVTDVEAEFQEAKQLFEQFFA